MAPPRCSVPASALEGGYGAVGPIKADRSQLGRNLVVTCLVLTHFIDGVDKVLLPASYRALERDLGLHPWHLGVLSMCQGCMMCLSAPVWGCLADHGVPRRFLIAGGCAGWGFCTAAQATCETFWIMAVLRLLNGIALGTVNPVAQSLILDLAKDGERGWLFGLCFGAIKLGEVLSAFCVTSISMTLVFGFSGWRVAFFTVGILSLMLSSFILLVMRERPKPWRLGEASLLGEFNNFVSTCRIPTFRLLVLQGCFGSIPMGVLDFLAMYFMYTGCTPSAAAVLMASYPLGAAAGSVAGGVIGDLLARWSKYHGRPTVALISVSAGIPIVAVLFTQIPRHPDSFFQYLAALLALGLFSTWCNSGVNAPILCQIIVDRQATVFAWLVAIQGGFASAVGAPATAFLAENVFGYEARRHTDVQRDEVFRSRQTRNAEALGSAMLWCTVVPWTLCLICYSFLHCTYKGDMIAAKRARGEPEEDDT